MVHPGGWVVLICIAIAIYVGGFVSLFIGPRGASSACVVAGATVALVANLKFRPQRKPTTKATDEKQ